MAHPPRHDAPGALHHVMNRAVGHRPFFESRADIRLFLAFLARAVRRGDVLVHAYAVLSTHFHLLVESPHGTLSDVLGVVQFRYVRRFNRARTRPGPLVRNRFRSKRVDSLGYVGNVVRYLDENPVAAGLASRAEDYPFSSAGVYLGRRRPPPWLETARVRDAATRLAPRGTAAADAYRAAFGRAATEAERRAIDRGLARGNRSRWTLGPVAGAHPLVQARFAARAQIADGTRMCSPGVDVDTLDAAVRAAVRRDPTAPWDVIRVGLFHDLAGETAVELAGRLGRSRSWVLEQLRSFRHALAVDSPTGRGVEAALRRVPVAWTQPA